MDNPCPQLALDFTPRSSELSRSIVDIMAANIPPPNVIVPGILVAGEATMLTAHAGGAKTFISQYMAACIASGAPCFGAHAQRPLKVLYIDGELSTYQIQQRFCLIYSDLGSYKNNDNLRIISKHSKLPSLPDMATHSGFSLLKEDIDDADVIIIDNLSALYPSSDEMIQNAWNFYNECIDKMRHAGKAVLILHHTDKNATSYRGHTEIVRAVDNVIIAKKDMKNSSNLRTVIELKKSKSRNDASGENLMALEFGFLQNTQQFTMRRTQ